MIAALFTLDFFFRVVNFFIIIGFATYGFRKYLYPWAHEKIVSRIRMIASLKEQKHSLKNRIEELNDEIKEEEEYATQVYTLMDRWNEQVNKQIQERRNKKEHITTHLDKQMRNKEEWITAHQFEKQVIPDALQDIQKQLVHYFKDDTKGTQFVVTIADYLTKKAKRETS